MLSLYRNDERRTRTLTFTWIHFWFTSYWTGRSTTVFSISLTTEDKRGDVFLYWTKGGSKERKPSHFLSRKKRSNSIEGLSIPFTPATDQEPPHGWNPLINTEGFDGRQGGISPFRCWIQRHSRCFFTSPVKSFWLDQVPDLRNHSWEFSQLGYRYTSVCLDKSLSISLCHKIGTEEVLIWTTTIMYMCFPKILGEGICSWGPKTETNEGLN